MKDIIINLIYKKHNERSDNRAIFNFIITNSATNSDNEFIHSALNCTVCYNMITNCPNSKCDSYFVNSEIKLTNGIQNECKHDNDNECKQSL